MSQIQRDIARMAVQVARIKQGVSALIEEISRDHYNIDSDTEWLIAIGNLPSFVGFRVKGLLELIAEEDLTELESGLRGAAAVTGAELLREWHELERAREIRESVRGSSSEERVSPRDVIRILMDRVPAAIGWN